MREGIKSFLGRSDTVRSAHDFVQTKCSRAYRSFHETDRTDQYAQITTDDHVRYDFNDSGVFETAADLKPHPDASNPVLTSEDIDDALVSFVADPFVVYADGLYNMFFEIKAISGAVYIAHAYSSDGVNYIYNKTIIEPEIAQHTYPYVFRYDDNWIMVPSPGANVNGQFRVYEATDFPTEWRLRTIPIKTGVRQDPTPILADETWFLIYQDTEDWDVVLKYADSLTDERWTEHPESPLFRNNKEELQRCEVGAAEMVPSGRPLYHDHHIDIFYRSHMNQKVYHYRITDITEQSFVQHRQSKIPVFENRSPEMWNARFMHTVNPVYPWHGTEDIVAVDGLQENQYTWSIGIYTPSRSEKEQEK